MPSQSHKERYFTKMLIAFGSVIASVLIIFYCIFEKSRDPGTNWYFWAVFSAFLLCSGIYFGLQAFIHKMKSDLNNRQKQREQQRTFTADN